MADLVAEVAIFGRLEKTLHYTVPPVFRGNAKVGMRVLVPLAHRHAMGIILSLSEEAPKATENLLLRPILDIPDKLPVLSPDLVALSHWLSRYYFYPIGEVLRTILPQGTDSSPQKRFRITHAGRLLLESGAVNGVLATLAQADNLSITELTQEAASPRTVMKEIRKLQEEGFVEYFFEWQSPGPKPKTTKRIRLISVPDSAQLDKNQNLGSLIALLQKSGFPLSINEIRQHTKNTDYWIGKLVSRGFAQIEEVEEIRESRFAQFLMPPSPFKLTQDQNKVLDAVLPCIRQPYFKPILLYGVTGSGKTEIYLRLAAETLELGKAALVLLPEITLSTQMEALFRQRFGKLLAIWHSGLPSGARMDQWREILKCNRRLILGVRSAIFTPADNLGLIIVDEEHDASYKQEDHLRYNARDVAIMRAKLLGIPVVLGSATPSLQSLHHCRSNRYTFLSLPNRVMDRPMPELEIVDMCREGRGGRILSSRLQHAVRETVEQGEQALIFLNRRGFAVFLLCSACGKVIQCSYCSVSLTYHQKDDVLRCHYCGWERPVPECCPSCDHPALFHHGFGTERIEEELKKLLPNERIVRVDRDTVNRSAKIAEYLNSIRHQRASILIGTQMIAKGHDFPNITLVGIVNADTSLQIPDFRAGETTVQLLMQVIGRAGRGNKPGRAIIQTYNPQHYTIESVLKMDYLNFCTKELESREQLQYPPFTRFMKLLITSSDEQLTKQASWELAGVCRKAAEELHRSGCHVAVLGPSPAPVAKVSQRYRWHIFLKAWTSQALQEILELVLSRRSDLPSLRHVHIAVDRDPVSAM